MKRILFLWLTLFATISLWAAFTPQAFTIAADGKQVYFSQGNLQCTLTATDTTWSFAENQYDMLGGDNISGSSLADKIDLFGWSGSTGTAKWGISTSFEVSDYSGDFVDWGKNIGDGTTYRTLTRGEWYYLLNTRTNAGEKKGVARIKLSDTEYANGLILLPDSWTCPAGITFKSGFASKYGIEDYATYQTFTLTEWQKLESAGAVFLPASGDRDGSSMRFVQYYSGYWSATAYDSFYSYYLCFYANGAFTYDGNSRCMGRPVRLVQDVKYTITLTTPDHGTIVADKTEAIVGEMISLTFVPDDTYELDKVIVKDATGETVAVTDNFTFTMPAGEVIVSAVFTRIDLQEWVDLGLPSGVRWATCNVGAYSPEIYGRFYAWGEIKNKDTYTAENYQYGSSADAMSKYNATDELTTLEATDDVATTRWGYKWRMPTEADWLELIKQCSWTWINDYNGTGVSGRVVTSKINGNSIFIPAAGAICGDTPGDVNGLGHYWSSTFNVSIPGCAASMDYHGGDVWIGGYGDRYCGRSVRPVQDLLYTITPAVCEQGTIQVDKNEAIVGTTITLTIIPNAYRSLKSFAVLQGETAIETTAVESTANQYTFTMPHGDVTITAEFEKIKPLFTPAAFSVAEGKQVYFSAGNLQCALSAADTVWSFAEYQTDHIGTDNLRDNVLADKIDLFGWSGSTGGSKWGISTSMEYTDYAGDFEDWGKNTIGTMAPSTYRTLTKDEWNYLLNTRAEDKRGIARINLNDDGSQYANGIILLPDAWTCPEGVTFVSGFGDNWGDEGYANKQTFTLAQWQLLETAGAVFLPTTGERYGIDVWAAQYISQYWTATPGASVDGSVSDAIETDENRVAYYLYSTTYSANIYESERIIGSAVRLVQDLYAITLTQPEYGTIAADKTEAAVGETVTLTIALNAYYNLLSLSVLQGETIIPTTAVEGTTNQYTFTMPAGAVTVSVTCEKIAPAFTPASFTVAYNKKVYFSSGNLQCSGLTTKDTTWSFAEYQTDYLGTDNVTEGTISYNYRGCESKIGTALADTIDLFGWSADNETAPWGISTTQSNADHAGNFVDWGKNIGDGTTYRTLNDNEWRYLLFYRANADNLKGVARILLSSDGSKFANGLIFLPDNWSCPDGVTFRSGLGSADNAQSFADHQTLTFAEWQKLEAEGAIFLPAAGDRRGTEAYIIRTNGDYWAASCKTAEGAYYLYFSGLRSDINHLNRHTGRSVRLVQDIKYPIMLTQPEHGSITADKTEAISGEMVTLTLSPDAYYNVKNISVQQGTAQVYASMIAANQYTFTMPQGDVEVSVEFERLTSAFTPAAFSVADGKQVTFSQGNLQCTLSATDTTWSFAEYQTDMLGTDNVSGGTESYDATYGYSKNGSALADKIDLFGWSDNTGKTQWGISTSTSDFDYSGDFVDWGTNTIGTNAPNTYRTLTYNEWYYLRYTRTNADNLIGVARIQLSDTEYANGLILLPDSWTCPAGIIFKSGFASEWSIEVYATYQTFSLAQWQQLEAAGAVFLPALGYRGGSSVYKVQHSGSYWSATAFSSNYANYLYFYSNEAHANNYNIRYYGQAVRLVQDVQVIPTDIDNAKNTAGVTARKVLMDGQVYIIRGGKIYTLTGVEVE